MEQQQNTDGCNDVINLAQPFRVQKVVYPVTEIKLQALEQEFAEFPRDLTVKKNYEVVKGGAKKLKKLINNTENHRKFLKKESLEYGRTVDSVAKQIRKRLSVLWSPMSNAITDYDNKEEIKRREIEKKEEERLESISNKIVQLKSVVDDVFYSNADHVKETIKQIMDNDPTLWAEEFTEKAIELKADTLKKLDELLILKRQSEMAAKKAEEAEQRRIKKEKEAEQALRIEAARLTVENKKQADALRIEREEFAAEKAAQEKRNKLAEAKIEAAKKAETAAMEAKKEQEEKEARLAKIEAEKADEAEKKRKERAKTLKADIEQTALDLLCFFDDKKANVDIAKEIVTGIRKNEMQHLKWV